MAITLALDMDMALAQFAQPLAVLEF
jgi:hypothetical protein